jgi:hypothetical protein
MAHISSGTIQFQKMNQKRKEVVIMFKSRRSMAAVASKRLFPVFMVLGLLISIVQFCQVGTLWAQENLTVTIGEDKIFTSFNLGQDATAYVNAGSYQELFDEAFAGVRFEVFPSPEGITMADAKISITVKYNLSVNFRVLPPDQEGGGSASARIYGWISGYKKELDSIELFESGKVARSGTVMFTQTLSQYPLFQFLTAGQVYEVKADVLTHADVYKDYYGKCQADVTVLEVRIEFGCDFSTEPNIEKCFGGIGSQCEGITFYLDQETCMAHGSMSVGSILHDKCCVDTDNRGVHCANPDGRRDCRDEWNLAVDDAVNCNRIWPAQWGPYFVGTQGDTVQNLTAPPGEKVHPDYEQYCSSGRCQVYQFHNKERKVYGSGRCRYCICQ